MRRAAANAVSARAHDRRAVTIAPGQPSGYTSYGHGCGEAEYRETWLERP